jgi:lipoprotein-anchoring transpeptidase ErfK/SrfK
MTDVLFTPLSVARRTRRAFLKDAGTVGAFLFVGGCTGTLGDDGSLASGALEPAPLPESEAAYALMYGAVETEPFPVAAIDLTKVDPAYLRREVAYPTPEPPGTIVVDPVAHYLYHVQPEGMATRYGVGVGREGFGWTGDAYIKFKREWPDWYPVEEMLERQPEIRDMLVPLQSGMGLPGGPRNPIGARGLYLWQDNVDTLYRIHGTTEPHTIGQSVSSGCIRMINQDVMHLYERVEVGSPVKVLPARTV